MGVLKWHFSVVLGERWAGNSSWMTQCYSIPSHGLHSVSTLIVIAAIFSDLWLISPPSLSSCFLLLHLLSSLLLPPPSSPPIPIAVYPLLRRPQAGDDLRLLADDLAGELLQYCHDHQAGGSGPGRFLFPFVLWPLQTQWKIDGRGMYFWSFLYHLLYVRGAAALQVVGGNGCRCRIVSDHLLRWWLGSKVKALMYMKAHGGTLWPLWY